MLLPEYAKPLFDIFEQEGEELYLVGGAVRDWMLFHLSIDPHITAEPAAPDSFTTKDLDFATSAYPERTKAILAKHGFKAYDIGIDFGTIGTFVNDVHCDITTYRCAESYTQGSRKPDVEFGETLKEDLKRRDFNINAAAMDGAGKIIDEHGAWYALTTSVFTTVGDPGQAFMDDPLRMLRMYRFAAQLPIRICSLDHQTVGAFRHLIGNISVERIVDEMTKILMTERPSFALWDMADSGLLGEIFPELQIVIDFRQNQGKWHSKLVWPHTLEVVDGTPAILPVRWAALFHDVAKPQTYEETATGVHFFQHDIIGAKVWRQVAQRLKLPNALRDEVEYLIYDHLRPAQLVRGDAVQDRALRKLIRDAGPHLDNLFHLSLSDITSKKADTVAARRASCLALKARIDALEAQHHVSAIKLPKGLGTRVSAALGIKAGPALGRIMKALETQLLAGDIKEEQLLTAARKIHEEQANG